MDEENRDNNPDVIMAKDIEHKDKRFVKVNQPQFWDLFVRPVYRGIALEVLAWIVFHTWGQRDWQKGENRRYTEEPISPSIIARDIGRPRENVSRAITELRADCVLIQDENHCERINKKRLRELAERDAHVTLKEGVTPASRDAGVTVSTTDRDAHVTDVGSDRDASVTPDSHNPQPSKKLRDPQTLNTDFFQTGASLARTTTYKSDFQAVVTWWKTAFQEQYKKPCRWNGKCGKLLKGLLKDPSASPNPRDEIIRRARYCLDNAGKPDTPIRRLNPPVTFPDFVANWDRCIDVPPGNSTKDAAECFPEVGHG